MAGVESRPVRLDELMAECWRAFEEQTCRRGLEVHWRVQSPLALEGDPAKLRLVLWNLFDNAVTYCDPGGSLGVHAEPAGEDVLIRVWNGGCTLPPREAERVFDRFWRGDSARAETGVHCGLGLSLCKELVELLGGSIEVQAEEGGQFHVSVKLPLRLRPSSRSRSVDATRVRTVG